VHIGPGKLGLGLVVATANEVNLDSHLVASKRPKPRYEQYNLALTGYQSIPLRFESFSKAGGFGDLEPETQKAIIARSGDPMLITTAVGNALAQCVDLIVEIVERRSTNGSGEALFIACENNVGACYAGLVERLEELGVDCRPTMVNRLCPEAIPNEDRTAVYIRADPYAEWMIEGANDHAALEQLQGAATVSFVPDVEPYCTRKRWLVNGGHLALALFARLRREPSIRVIANEADRQQQLLDLQTEMIDVLPAKWRAILADSAKYGEEQIVPFCRTDDDTTRILSRLKRADLKPFMEDADRKLGEPARRYRAQFGCESPQFREVFRAMHEVLRRLNSYEDAPDVRKGLIALDEASDKEAVFAYRRLLNGTVSRDTRDERVKDLNRRFERQRELA
jgi:hypothetical protein